MSNLQIPKGLKLKYSRNDGEDDYWTVVTHPGGERTSPEMVVSKLQLWIEEHKKNLADIAAKPNSEKSRSLMDELCSE